MSEVKFQHALSPVADESPDGNQSTPEPSSPYTPLIRGRKKKDDQMSTTPPARIGSATTDDLVDSRPLLYSAIGSLESSSLTNIGSFQNRFLHDNNSKPSAPKSGFPSISPAHVIPPSNAKQHPYSNSTTTWSTASVKIHSSSTIQEAKTITPPKAGLMSALESHAAATAAAAASNQRHHNTNTNDLIVEKKMSGTDLEAQQSLDSTAGSGGGILKKRLSFPRLNSDQPTKHTSFSKNVSVISAPKEVFRPSCDAYTPRIQSRSKIPKYVNPESRRPVEAGTMGTISRPNFRDALKRVAMILHQHITKIERRFDDTSSDASIGSSSIKRKRTLFSPEMRDLYSEDVFLIPRYKCTMIRMPIMSMGSTCMLKEQIQQDYTIPTSDEIYEFAHQLFKRVQLSSECSIVCLIYVERLMEVAKVPLLAKTWRPIFMCGLLLASKVWQDLSSWNIEFASVYPQYSLEAINRLELQFVSHIKWDLYISSSLYAKYYFALRSLLEKKDFRQRYNRMVGGVDNVAQSEALKIQQRTEVVKEEALMLLSRSME